MYIGWQAKLRLSAPMLLTTFLPACMSWRTESAPPEQVIARDHPGRLRVERKDSTRVVLSQPRLSGDSLIGFQNKMESGMPLADVSSVAARKLDVAKTVGIPLAAFGLMFLIACAGDGGDYVC